MKLFTAPYLAQSAQWPVTGRHILAQYNQDNIVVYQAYRPDIGCFAAQHGYFGGKFSLSRMSWIKPSFLWMMFRCGWASKVDQETVLAVTLKRAVFDTILREAVPSSFTPELYPNEETWKEALAHSSVRLQWDPDHAPSGAKLERRAIQLGLRGDMLQRYAREWIVHIEDITDFVHVQAMNVRAGDWEKLVTPREEEYLVNDALRLKLGISSPRQSI